jgi:hypothetical protein
VGEETDFITVVYHTICIELHPKWEKSKQCASGDQEGQDTPWLRSELVRPSNELEVDEYANGLTDPCEKDSPPEDPFAEYDSTQDPNIRYSHIFRLYTSSVDFQPYEWYGQGK